MVTVDCPGSSLIINRGTMQPIRFRKIHRDHFECSYWIFDGYEQSTSISIYYIFVSFVVNLRLSYALKNVLFMTVLERLFRTMGKVDFAHIHLLRNNEWIIITFLEPWEWNKFKEILKEIFLNLMSSISSLIIIIMIMRWK